MFVDEKSKRVGYFYLFPGRQILFKKKNFAQRRLFLLILPSEILNFFVQSRINLFPRITQTRHTYIGNDCDSKSWNRKLTGIILVILYDFETPNCLHKKTLFCLSSKCKNNFCINYCAAREVLILRE